MKIALSAEGKNLDSQVSSVFGRCQYFVFVEFQEGELIDNEAVENSAAVQSSGAGTAAAQLVGDKGADVLISRSVGPKAFSALDNWNIEVYKGESGTVRGNIDKFSSGKLEKLESSTGAARMGMDER